MGKKSYFSNNASTCLKKLNKNDKHIPQDLLSYLEKDNACKGYFYIEQSEKENIRKTLIKPIKVEKNTNGVILSDTLTFHNEEYENLISQGYWFKNNFTVSIEKNEKALNLDVAVSLSGAFYKSPDFKIYIQSDKKYELKDTNISVSHSRDDIDKTNSEIVKVFSQSRMKYFDEWQKLGIHENSLFRIKMNSISENKTFKSGINELQLNIKLEDSETPVSREKNLIIFSLFLSLFLSFGFDITRQQELNFQLIFPYLAKEYFTIDALWIFLCLSIFIKYNYLEKTKVNKLIGSFTLLPLLIWFSMYILHPSIYLSFKFLCWLYYIDCSIAIIVILLHWRVSRQSKRMKTGKIKEFNRFDKFIGA